MVRQRIGRDAARMGGTYQAISGGVCRLHGARVNVCSKDGLPIKSMVVGFVACAMVRK